MTVKIINDKSCFPEFNISHMRISRIARGRNRFIVERAVI